MNITELKKDSTEFHVKVVIPTTDLDKEIENQLVKLSKNAKIDGFRVGKIPLSILKKRFGETARFEAVKAKIEASVDGITESNKLDPLEYPDISDVVNEAGKDLEFTVKYQLIPEVSMPDFKKITIEKPVLKISDKDIQETLSFLADKNKDYSKEAKGKAKNGDQLTINAVGYIDGKPFEGGKLDEYKLVLGSGVFIPGFEDQLVGAKKGDDVSVNVTFPEDYFEKSLAGKPAEFKVQVLAVHTPLTPEINDEFAKNFHVDSLEKLKEAISENMKKSYEGHIYTIMKMELFDKLEKVLEFDVPSSLLNREVTILKDQVKNNFDEELEAKSADEKEAYFKKLGLRRVRIGFILSEYVKLNNISIEAKDLQEAVITQARNFPGKEREIIELYNKNPSLIENLKGSVIEDKAVKTIFDTEVKIVEKSYTKAKLEEIIG